jgi:hypothetical protein
LSAAPSGRWRRKGQRPRFYNNLPELLGMLAPSAHPSSSSFGSCQSLEVFSRRRHFKTSCDSRGVHPAERSGDGDTKSARSLLAILEILITYVTAHRAPHNWSDKRPLGHLQSAPTRLAQNKRNSGLARALIDVDA